MSLLMSIAFKHRTGNVNVLILDLLGKERSDFDVFNGQQFLSAPIITEPDIGRKAILLLYEEKIRRLKNRNLSYMPHIICVIDEFPRLYSGITNKEDMDKVKSAMNELLSSGRHANIHLVLAVQNPVREDVKGSIANITARIALKCAHYQISKTILGRAGAEKLVGRGQMIFDFISERDKILQGSYISHKEIKVLLAEIERTFDQQNKYREYQIGNNRAIRVLDQMKGMGLIYELNGNLGWKVIPKCFENIPAKALNYLKENGVSESKIRAVFGENM